MTALAAAPAAWPAAVPAEVRADAPADLSVTLYRAPYRSPGSLDLDRLGGFALVSEIRTVRLPAGESRLRFEGVADGIEPASAIVTGLDGVVLEKNRDAALLSPRALIDAAAGKPVQLLRADAKTGEPERLPGRILSDADGGVVFETAQGIEALRCSGLSESFSFAGIGALSAHPVLSVLVQSPHPVSRQVTLSYLARGFDWTADYTATLSADGKSMDLGAWVTLANGNGVGFPAAHTQVVAGRVNREGADVRPLDAGGPILARCWPRGSTSDTPVLLQLTGALSRSETARAAIMPMAMLAAPAADAQHVAQEQLGDLKLYRVPEPTTVASRQSKQVRLMDRHEIPVEVIYVAELDSGAASVAVAAGRRLRTRNTAAHHLGLALPSGSVAVFASHDGMRLLERESAIQDLAVGEELELDAGASPDVRLSATSETADADRRANRVEIRNARPGAIRFELRLRLPDGARLIHADHAAVTENGRPLFRLDVPAAATVTLRYEVEPAPALKNPR
jgi:hypothetical protein